MHSRRPGEADVDPGRGRVSTWVRRVWGQRLCRHTQSQQEGASGTEDTCSQRGGRGTLGDLGPCAPSHPDTRYSHRNPFTVFHLELSSCLA